MRRNSSRFVYLAILAVSFLGLGSIGLANDVSDDTVTAQPHKPLSYWETTLPEGKGKEIIVRSCEFCHDLQRVVAFSRPKEQWDEVVHAMIGRGSTVQAEEVPVLVDYLTQNFGPSSESRGLTAMQPCKQSEWPKGAPDFRTAWHGSYTIWASDQQGGTVDIIDPTQNKVVRRIRCISAPDRVEFSPDGNTAYIPDRVEWNLTVVDTRTGAIIKKIPVRARPNTAVITRDGKKLYMSIWPVRDDEGTKGYVEVIDTTKLEVVKVIETNAGIHDTWMSKDGKMLLAMSGAASARRDANRFMNAYDTNTEKLLWTCCTEAAIGTMEMEKGPDGSTSRVFVGYMNYPGVLVIDGKTGKEINRFKFPTDTEGPYAEVGPGHFHGNEISSDGKSVWFFGDGGKTLYEYSLPDLKHIAHIHLADVDQAGAPFKPKVDGSWLTISPDGKTVYAARPGRNLIAVIDVATMKEVTQIPTGEYPLHISIWPRGTP